MPPLFRLLPVVFLAAVACASAGCKPDDDIRTYTVPKEKDKPAAPKDAPTGPDKERTLGAIIPLDGKYNAFVKLRGPIEALEPLEKDFDAFVQTVRVNGPDKPPTWTAPASATWREGPPKQLRYVTYQTGPADKPVEMVLSGPFGGSLLENVNRWRGEVGLRNITEAELKGETTEIKLGDATAYRVDLRGPGGKGGGMLPPFAK